MEGCTVDNSSKKRAREFSTEFEPNSPELKRVNTNAYSDPYPFESQPVTKESDDNSAELFGFDPENEFNSAEARFIRDDILDILDDTDIVPLSQDLDSVMRSFEEEILHGSPSASHPAVVELTSDSGTSSQPELGFLWEASDDELGLPPTGVQAQEDEPVKTTTTALGNWFEDDLLSYDPFGIGIVEKPIEVGGDFVAVDGLFDFSDFIWRPESLPAL